MGTGAIPSTTVRMILRFLHTASAVVFSCTNNKKKRRGGGFAEKSKKMSDDVQVLDKTGNSTAHHMRPFLYGAVVKKTG